MGATVYEVTAVRLLHVVPTPRSRPIHFLSPWRGTLTAAAGLGDPDHGTTEGVGQYPGHSERDSGTTAPEGEGLTRGGITPQAGCDK